MDNPVEHLAASLKQRRARLGWSLSETAKQTGVSKAMLGQIERGESSPTVSTLWKIATGLNVSLSSLLETLPEEQKQAVTLLRDAATLRKQLDEEGLLISQLFPYDPQVSFEYFEMILPPGYERLSAAHNIGVLEFITVVEGTIEILSEGSWHALGKGQSLRIKGDLPHGYRNKEGDAVTVMCVIYYPARGFPALT
ncbi:MAG: XRE family transcriptional regulator [Gammaproteobacteria bacterium]|nr:XRE family transcriptional regulator [Gammaproteobacteria bacterium]